MGFAMLLAGLVIFLGPHLFVTRRGERAALIGWIGEVPYKIAFSLISAVGLFLIGFGFGVHRQAGQIALWTPPYAMHYVAIPLMWFAFVALAATYFPGNIKRILKHPMLASIKAWALAHLLTNGDVASLVLFGAFLAWAVFDRISLKYRSDPGGPPIPVGGIKNDMIAVVVGTIVFAAFGYVFHPLWIGVPVFGTS